ncbi:MAG: flippase-like domain-containing protein [Rhodospirillales bacterium]|nr:flippase-like domain-containing protein [Rhodospirillales bacterium]
MLGKVLPETVEAKILELFEFRSLSNPRTRNIVLLAALVVICGGIFLSLRRQPDLFDNLEWWPIVAVAVIGIPITILLNAVEFILSGKLIGRNIQLLKALEVTIIGSAANVLPLPGSMMVRVAALKASGARYRESVSVTLLFAGIWAGVALAFFGAMTAFYHPGLLAIIFLGAGIAILAACLIAARRISSNMLLMFFAFFQKTALVLTDTVRFYFYLKAIGLDPALAQASAYAVSAVIGSAVSIVPAGLGVREAASAALAPAVGMSAALGFIAASMDRILGFIILLPIGSALAWRLRGRAGNGK